MPNPKDIIGIRCSLCGYSEIRANETYTFNCNCPPNPIHTHYPGCHKIHIQCANKAIDEAIRIMACLADPNKYLYMSPENKDAALWIKSLGVEG